MKKDLINKDMAELAWASYSEGLNEEIYGDNSKGVDNLTPFHHKSL